MSERPSSPSSPANSPVEPDLVHAMRHFLRVVYRRKGIIVVALTVSCLLGGLWCATAPRIYESQSSLMMLQMEETKSVLIPSGRNLQQRMTTYENMVRSETVIKAALKLLPPEHLGDLKEVSSQNRGAVLRHNLNISTVQNAPVLNLAYRCKNPKAAAAILDSIVSVYVDHVNHLQQDTLSKLLDILNNEKVKLEKQMRAKQCQIRNAQLQQLNSENSAPLLLGTTRHQSTEETEREKVRLANYEEGKFTALELDQRGQLDVLECDRYRLQRMYDIFLTRLKGIENIKVLQVSVLARPEVSMEAVSPRKKNVALLSITLGLIVGFGSVYLLDRLDDRFRSPEELQSQLHLPILAVVRRLQPLAENGVNMIHTHVQPRAVETEAFRTLRTVLTLAKDNLRSLVVSSCEPGDGKTTIVANLAIAYAQSGRRTLLVDANMRSPGLTARLNLRGEKGLSTVLRSESPIAEAAQAAVYPSLAENLDVLPSGLRPTNPCELLAGDRFSGLLSWAETKYDQILIDSSPAMVSDTAVIGSLVDGIVLAVQPHKNRRRVVIQVAGSLSLLPIKVLGIVVNCVRSEEAKDYCGYCNTYGYGDGYGDDHDSSKDNARTGETAQPLPTIVPKAA